MFWEKVSLDFAFARDVSKKENDKAMQANVAMFYQCAKLLNIVNLTQNYHNSSFQFFSTLPKGFLAVSCLYIFYAPKKKKMHVFNRAALSSKKKQNLNYFEQKKKKPPQTVKKSEMGNAATGFVAAMVAAVGFGSNYVPVKKFDMGDGMLFQLVMAMGIWTLGMFYTIIRSSAIESGPWIHPMAMVGGILWNTGNVLTVVIIKCVGMALGLAIWSGTSMLVGWATGKWGLLGTPKDSSVKTPWLNYFGLVLVLSSLALFFNVKPNNKDSSVDKVAKIVEEEDDNDEDENEEEEDDDNKHDQPKAMPVAT
ncbi:hypothetical protein RFI_23010, partial [Reticulomyxa filosa]